MHCNVTLKFKQSHFYIYFDIVNAIDECNWKFNLQFIILLKCLYFQTQCTSRRAGGHRLNLSTWRISMEPIFHRWAGLVCRAPQFWQRYCNEYTTLWVGLLLVESIGGSFLNGLWNNVAWLAKIIKTASIYCVIITVSISKNAAPYSSVARCPLHSNLIKT